MKHNSRIKNVKDNIIELHDGSRWEATDISTQIKLPMWMVLDEIEGDDFGINAYLTNTRRDETLKATLLT